MKRGLWGQLQQRWKERRLIQQPIARLITFPIKCKVKPGEGNGKYPLQYSCLENSMDRGVWQAPVHGVTKSQTQLSHKCVRTCVHTHTRTHTHTVKPDFSGIFMCLQVLLESFLVVVFYQKSTGGSPQVMDLCAWDQAQNQFTWSRRLRLLYYPPNSRSFTHENQPLDTEILSKGLPPSHSPRPSFPTHLSFSPRLFNTHTHTHTHTSPYWPDP